MGTCAHFVRIRIGNGYILSESNGCPWIGGCCKCFNVCKKVTYVIELTQILENLSDSIGPLQEVITGFAYMIGIIFIFSAIYKMKAYGQGSAFEPVSLSPIIPFFYFLAGACFLFLPTVLDVMRQTLFGTDSPLAYSQWLSAFGSATAQEVVVRLIQTAGLVWFVRGWILMAESTEPGKRHGARGAAFMVAGIVAINILYTAEMLSTITALFLKYYQGVTVTGSSSGSFIPH